MARKSSAAMPRKRHGAAADVAARVNNEMKASLISFGADPNYQIEKVTTGSLLIDRMTLGGFARGRHVEIFGDWQVGKSLIVYLTLVAAQQRGEICAIVDGEGVFDEAWFQQLGGDIGSLLKYRPQTAEELANVLSLFVQHDDSVRAVDVVGIDSVASMLPREELMFDYEGSPQPAGLARLMSMLLRRVTTMNDRTLFIWTNQWRDKISRIPGLKSTPGGRALGFYASTRLEMMQGEKETVEREVVVKGKPQKRKVVQGRWINCRLAKEKTGGRPEDFGAFMLDYDRKCIDRAREIVDLSMRDGVMTREGDYFVVSSHDGGVRYHGIKRILAAIEETPLGDYLVDCIQMQTELLAEGDDG